MRGLAFALLALGVADLVWINASLGPRALSDQDPTTEHAPSLPEPAAIAQAPEPVPEAEPVPVPETKPVPVPVPEAVPEAVPETVPVPVPVPDPASTTVVFDLGTDKLDADAKDQLTEAIATLAADPDLRVELAGHADARGSDITNYRLGLRRARAVRSHLVRNGVDKDRITAYSAGERRPASRVDGEEGFRLNRRVELTIYQKDDR